MEEKFNELSLPAVECALMLEVDQIKLKAFKPILENKKGWLLWSVERIPVLMIKRTGFA